jgi:hypothetical protein
MTTIAPSAAHPIGGGFAPKLFGLRAVLENAAETGAGGSPPAASSPPAPAPGTVTISEAELSALRASAAKASTLEQDLGTLRTRVSALEPLETEVRGYRDRDASELAAIEARKGTLTDVQKAALDAASGVANKRAVLALIDGGTKPAAPAPPPTPTATPPAMDAPIDFAAAFKDGKSWAAAKAKNPDGAKAWFDAHSAGGRKESTIDAMRRARTSK